MSEEEKPEINKFIRRIAIKTTIQEVSYGSIEKEDESTPQYIKTLHHGKIYRLNVMGIVVQKEKFGSITNLLIDDGTEKIIIRSFEENKNINTIDIGNAVLIIGKAREYNNEIYISPEIIKIINPLWLKVRSLELKELVELSKEIVKEKIETETIVKESSIIEEKIIDEEEVKENEIEENPLLPIERVSKLIKELDQGDGVLIEEIIEKSTLEDTEQIIERMMESGDIFQNKPGRVKVL